MSQQINLYNPIFLKKKKYFSAYTMLQGLALILAGALAFYAYAAYQVNGLKAQSAETDRQLAEAQSRLAKLQQLLKPTQQSQQLQNEIARLETQLQSREQVVGILQDGSIGNRLGYSAYLHALARQDMEGVWLTGFTISGASNQMSIDGRSLKAEDVPVYIQRLSREALMRGRTFAALEISSPKITPSSAAATPAKLPSFVEFSLRSGEEKEKPQ